MKHVNIYTYSSLKLPKTAETLNAAVGYILEFKTPKGTCTRTQTFLLCNIANEMTANQSNLIVLEKALTRMNIKCELDIWTDSQYIASAFEQEWIKSWITNGWKGANGQEIAHKKEWQKLIMQIQGNIVRFHVKEDHEYRSWLIDEVENKREFVEKGEQT